MVLLRNFCHSKPSAKKNTLVELKNQQRLMKEKMKKNVLFRALIAFFLDRNIANDNSDDIQNILPIESYIVLANFPLIEAFVIKLKYLKIASCHLFQGIYYDKNFNIQTIVIQTTVKNNQSCIQDVFPLKGVFYTLPLPLSKPMSLTFIKNFYKGKEAKVEGVFEDVEILVA